jgi:hypothetical protein
MEVLRLLDFVAKSFAGLLGVAGARVAGGEALARNVVTKPFKTAESTVPSALITVSGGTQLGIPVGRVYGIMYVNLVKGVASAGQIPDISIYYLFFRSIIHNT